MNFIIKQTRSHEELQLVGKYRYKIYEKIGFKSVNMDPIDKVCLETIDLKSIVLYHSENHIIDGTVRGTLYNKIQKSEVPLLKKYSLFDYKDACQENSAEVDHLCTSVSGVSIALMKKILEIGLSENPNLKYTFTEALESLIKYYEFFCFKQFEPPSFRTGYNQPLYPMVLDLQKIRLSQNFFG